MFIREYVTTNKKTGAKYTVHRLVESYRTDKGPRQRIVMHLGTLSIPKTEWKKLAIALESRLSGQISLFEEDSQIATAADQAMQHYQFKQLQSDDKTAQSKDQNFVPVDLNSVTTMQSRQLGPELAGHTIWECLNLDDILKSCGLSSKKTALAAAVVIGRLVNPSSELATWDWIKNRTALTELLAEDISNIGKNAVYEIADTLLKHKDTIETALRAKEVALFPEQKTLFLYDLTNTYFEGSANNNELAKRGKSKEKRSDCSLVTLALLVDSRGLPVFSQVYQGNQSEPQTLQSVLTRLLTDCQDKLVQVMPTIVMDRGIATKENIKLLQDQQFPYVIIERRAVEKDYLEEFEKARETFEIINNDSNSSANSANIYVKKIPGEQGTKVLCLSEGKEQKETAMDNLKEKRFIEDITRLKNSVNRRNILKPEKVSERIGRLRERYPTVARYYDINPVADENNIETVDITWTKKETRDQRSTLTGCYVIESSHQELSAREIWNIYNTLTQVEYSFRCLKTDLGMRPVHHQLAKRTEAHLFISILAYHLLICIENHLRDQNDTRKWSTIKTQLSTHIRSTVVMTDNEGRIHHIRVSGMQEKNHTDIYKKLGAKDLTKKLYKTMQKRL